LKLMKRNHCKVKALNRGINLLRVYPFCHIIITILYKNGSSFIRG
jgi:hypothetical protein